MKISDIMDLLGSVNGDLPIMNVGEEFFSYRGEGNQLSVEPDYIEGLTVRKFLLLLDENTNKSFKSRGSVFTMSKNTQLYMAYWGKLGDAVSGIQVTKKLGVVCVYLEIER
ncbi:hypothetical protein GD1_186 [Paraglaciecola Antarctic GD virus 1]|nr:hypothetical protein GD1_186 [Paraglaciecola Antarctic GD virus 1]